MAPFSHQNPPFFFAPALNKLFIDLPQKLNWSQCGLDKNTSHFLFLVLSREHKMECSSNSPLQQFRATAATDPSFYFIYVFPASSFVSSLCHLLKCQGVLWAQSPVSHNNPGAKPTNSNFIANARRPICGWLK